MAERGKAIRLAGAGLAVGGGAALVWLLISLVLGGGGEVAEVPEDGLAASPTSQDEQAEGAVHEEIVESQVSRSSATVIDGDGPTDCATGMTPVDLPWADVLGAELTYGDGIPLTVVLEFGGIPEDVWHLVVTACPTSVDDSCVDHEYELIEAAFAEGPEPSPDHPYFDRGLGGSEFALWVHSNHFFTRTWFDAQFEGSYLFSAQVEASGACDSLEAVLAPAGG